ncbi:MAG: carbohydrate binding family 9 domain-containing protein [candidate division WOR-3 bacterium]
MIKFIFLFSYLLTIQKFEEGKIVIDGILSENEWLSLTPITEFVEFQPEEGEIPPVKTEVFIGYDDKSIYFAFKCYDDIKTIRKTLTKRDELAMDDMVVIFLDTYGKEKEGYIFGTNPLGVQFDGLKGAPPQNIEDWSFDTYFEVKSSISDSFWSCEFKIPFSSLRFESKEKQEWNLILLRIRPRETFTIYSFPLLSKNIPSFFGQGAKIIIPERIYSKEKRNDFIPYLISSQTGIRDSINYKNENVRFNLGLSGKTRIYQNLVLDYALNPDFAQIETDIPQIDINTTYALYYPEKRPLFMEGSQYINMPLDLFYTRMINNPLYALKLTGEISIFDIYFLSSYDENTPFILPFEDASFSFGSDKKSFVNLLRVRSDFLNKESYIGFLIGDRELKRDNFDNGYGRIFGFDTRLRFLNHYTIEYQGGYSITKEPEDTNLFSGIGMNFKDYTDKFDGEKFSGYANNLSFSYYIRNLSLNLFYKENSEGFRSDIGYIERNNFKTRGFGVAPIFYPNRFGITEFSIPIEYSKETNFENVFKREYVKGGLNTSFSFAQLKFNFRYTHENKNTYNIYFLRYSRFNDIYSYSFSLNGVPLKFLYFNLSYKEGKSIFYHYDTLLYKTSISGSLSLLLTKMVSGVGIERETYYLERYKGKIEEGEVVYGILNYNFTDKISLRVMITYYKGFTGIYPLFSYELTPFTVFYFGANINTMKYPDKMEGRDHQVFLKFQYVFKI